jgi:hypothetical protein
MYNEFRSEVVLYKWINSMPILLRDRTKITWPKLPAKVLKRPDILLTECQVIFEPTLR